MTRYPIAMQRGVTFRQMLGRVMAVLCLLFVAAVLFPVFMKAKECTHCPSCLGMEKQLGLGLLQYADDYDGLMPPATHDPKNTWRVAIYRYVESDGVYKCPDDGRGTPGPDGHFQSYAFNTGSVLDTPGAKPQILGSAPHPETLVLLCEVQNTTDADFDIDDPVRFSPDKHILAVRHSGGSNYLLADGHAKWFRPSAFTYAPPTTGKTGHAVVRWHRDPLHPLSRNEIATLADAQARAQ